jgi:hypothetical protein
LLDEIEGLLDMPAIAPPAGRAAHRAHVILPCW